MLETKKRGIVKLLVLIILLYLLINLSLISAYLLITKYSTFTLYPGENYIINIPFNPIMKFQTVCGKAQFVNGTPIEGINVTLKSIDDTINLINTTKSDGKYCFNIQELTSDKGFEIYISYDNYSMNNASNDYELNLDNYKVYSKTSDPYIILTGKIENYDAEVENGRFEIKMGYKVDGTWKYTFGDYQKYYLNINPGETYNIPSEELNYTWDISQLDIGEYKFLIKTSLNGREYSYRHTGNTIYFNITS